MSWAGPRGCEADVTRLIPLNETRPARHTPPLSTQPMGTRGREIRGMGGGTWTGRGKGELKKRVG